MSSRVKNKQEKEVMVEQEQPKEIVAEQKELEPQEAMIYVGPSLPGGMLTKYTIFSNGVPDHLKLHFEKCPAFKRLFVPVSQLSAVESRLNDATSAESVFYQQIVQYFSRKG
ncbi:hypothetical protein B1689_07490 [Geobacillus sp. 44C]|nr:hypothetical protein B1689_07490 [Geobacillus sp. 44C]QNU33487.1 hypothetical protein IC802_11220 [Geobacillus sp. 44C]